MRIGPTEMEVLSCAPALTNVSIQIYGGAEVCGPESSHASVSRTTILIMPTLASVCSTRGRQQTVNISMHSVRKRKRYEHNTLGSTHAPDPTTMLRRALSCTGSKLVSEVSLQPQLIMRHCIFVSFSRNFV